MIYNSYLISRQLVSEIVTRISDLRKRIYQIKILEHQPAITYTDKKQRRVDLVQTSHNFII